MLQTEKIKKSQASRQILEALQERIGQGMYSPGARLPTERELSAEFAADRSAVRTALNHLAQAGLVVRERGRRPWVNPRSEIGLVKQGGLRREATPQVLAVVLPQHEADHASRQILRGVSDTLRMQPAPYRALIFDTNLRSASRSVLEQEACAAMMDEGIAGAIVWPTLDAGSSASWQRVRDHGHAVVFVDRYDEGTPCDFVGVDNYAAGREAVEYLLGLGHTRIALLTHSEAVSSVRQRGEGFRDALRAAGLPERGGAPWVNVVGKTPECLEGFVTHCLEDAEPPTAVFSINDFMAYQLIALLEARGLRVPDDISVVGFDDSDRYSPRPALLTSVRQPFERIGQRAAGLLLQRLDAVEPSARPYQHILLPTSLIERRTCRPTEKPSLASHVLLSD